MCFARYVVALTLLFLSSTAALAYEDDTHYLMTYVICRTVGFTHAEALYVAAADVAMDDRDNTLAAGTTDGNPGSTIQAHVDAQWMWHAIPPSDEAWNQMQDTTDIQLQKNLLYQLALDKWLGASLATPNPNPQEIAPQVKERLFWLGVFFHYQQDMWAHRRWLPRPQQWDTRTNFQAYKTPFGHVAGAVIFGLPYLAAADDPNLPITIHNQDLPPWHPLAALRNLEDGIIYAGFFLKTILKREPNHFFVNFEIGRGNNRDDQTWPRKGGRGHFNQITLVATTEAGKYLEALIWAQIDKYTNNSTGLKADDTANENIPLEKVQAAFAKVWKDYADKLELGKDDLAAVPLDKAGRGSVLGVLGEKCKGYDPCNKDFGPNHMVAKMDGWQFVLGFPTTAKQYLSLYPTRPNGRNDLRNLLGAWRSFSAAPPGTQVSDLMPWRDTFLAVADGALWYKDKQEKWQQVPNSRPNGSGKIVTAKLHRDGVVLEVLDTGELASNFPSSAPDGAPQFDEKKWETTTLPPGEIKSLTVMRDDGTTIYGVINSKLQKTKLLKDYNNKYGHDAYRLECCWQDVPPTETPLSAVTVMSNQMSFFGVSQDGALLFKSDLEQPWKRAANSNAFAAAGEAGGSVPLRSVTMLPNGDLLGIRKDTGELLIKRRCVADPQPTVGQLWNVVSQCSGWPYLDPDRLPEDGTVKSGDPFSGLHVVWP
jgi:hypothetical protein